MSQELTPIPNSQGVVGLSPQLTTSAPLVGPKYFSPEYKSTKGLKVQPTEWVPAGRPIYGRLPAASEQYQQEFFADGGRGYVYVPPGGDQFGPGSLYVNQSENLQTLLIENGVIVWEQGTTPVYKAIVDFREIGLQDGRFLVCYQLIYDDAPEPLPFRVSEYSLAGLDFTVSDSASVSFNNVGNDTENPWPFPGSYAFLPSSRDLRWQNFIDVVNRQPQASDGTLPGLPDYEQPLLSYITWDSPLPWKLDRIKVRTSFSTNVPNCSLYIGTGDVEDPWTLVQTQAPLKDSEGFYWEFNSDMVPQTEWKLEWPPQTRVDAYGIEVSGVILINTRPTTERARAQLALYPTNLIPEDESLCRLAIISVDNFEITRKTNGDLYKDDIREIVTRDYQPVADWLTIFWDRQLVGMWEKVKTFVPGFMAPRTLLKESYADLEAYGIDVSDAPPPLPPQPPKPTTCELVLATVTLVPPTVPGASLTDVSVTLSPDPGAPQISDLTLVINP